MESIIHPPGVTPVTEKYAFAPVISALAFKGAAAFDRGELRFASVQCRSN
jgi:hypothetical protein